METLRVIGLALLALLFISGGVKHLLNHSAMVAYTASALGRCPLAKLSVLGGAPVGLFLLVTGVLVAYGNVAGFWLGAGFLAVATAVFHRDIKSSDFTTMVGLVGAMTVLATHAAA